MALSKVYDPMLQSTVVCGAIDKNEPCAANHMVKRQIVHTSVVLVIMEKASLFIDTMTGKLAVHCSSKKAFCLILLN